MGGRMLDAVNRDDHGRNHAFLYNEQNRSWALSPAYDLNPNVANVLIGLSWLGSSRIPERFDDLLRLAEVGGISGKVARSIYDQTEQAVIGGWSRSATAAGVPSPMIEYWARELDRQTAALRGAAKTSPR